MEHRVNALHRLDAIDNARAFIDEDARADALAEPSITSPVKCARRWSQPAARRTLFALIAEKQLGDHAHQPVVHVERRLSHCCHHSANVSAPKRCTSGKSHHLRCCPSIADTTVVNDRGGPRMTRSEFIISLSAGRRVRSAAHPVYSQSGRRSSVSIAPFAHKAASDSGQLSWFPTPALFPVSDAACSDCISAAAERMLCRCS